MERQQLQQNLEAQEERLRKLTDSLKGMRNLRSFHEREDTDRTSMNIGETHLTPDELRARIDRTQHAKEVLEREIVKLRNKVDKKLVIELTRLENSSGWKVKERAKHTRRTKPVSYRESPLTEQENDSDEDKLVIDEKKRRAPRRKKTNRRINHSGKKTTRKPATTTRDSTETPTTTQTTNQTTDRKRSTEVPNNQKPLKKRKLQLTEQTEEIPMEELPKTVEELLNRIKKEDHEPSPPHPNANTNIVGTVEVKDSKDEIKEEQEDQPTKTADNEEDCIITKQIPGRKKRQPKMEHPQETTELHPTTQSRTPEPENQSPHTQPTDSVETTPNTPSSSNERETIPEQTTTPTTEENSPTNNQTTATRQPSETHQGEQDATPTVQVHG